MSLFFSCKRCRKIIEDDNFMEYDSAIHEHMSKEHLKGNSYGYLCELLDQYDEVKTEGQMFCLL